MRPCVQTGPQRSNDHAQRRYLVGTHPVDVEQLAPGLHIVATPIGNLADITIRALAALAGADLIACEDTRVTRKLLDRYAITTPLTPYHDHNAARGAAEAVAPARRRRRDRTRVGRRDAAGLRPGIQAGARRSGRRPYRHGAAGAFVRACGPDIAGLPTDQFLFAGFLPPKQAARRTRIAELARVPATIVLFETGPRIAATLADLAAGLGPREAALCRELTKLHEEVRRGDLGTLAQNYAGRKSAASSLSSLRRRRRRRPSADDTDTLLRQALARVSLKDAVGEVAAATGLPRRELYQRALALAKRSRPWHG